MKNGVFFAILFSCTLAGCVVPPTPDVAPPPERIITRDDMADARAACISEARRQGRDSIRVENARFAGGVNYEVRLHARGPAGPETLLCVYNAQYRTATFDARPDVPRDVYSEARNACISEARSRGRDVIDVEHTQHLGGSKYRIVMRARGPAGTERLSCVYDAHYRTTSLDIRAEGHRDYYADARNACVSEARRLGMDVLGVQSTQHLSGPRYKVRLRCKVPHRIIYPDCNYNAANGNVTIH
jgi:hypothetical protein